MKVSAWLILRDRGLRGITGVLYSPHGAQLSPVQVGVDECDARRRVLTPARMRLLTRIHPDAEVAVVHPDDPIPDSLRKALRNYWGRYYEGSPDGNRGSVQEPPDAQLDVGA